MSVNFNIYLLLIFKYLNIYKIYVAKFLGRNQWSVEETAIIKYKLE